jgi:hypothetical protein
VILGFDRDDAPRAKCGICRSFSKSSRDIEIVQRSQFHFSDTAADNHIGVTLKPRRVFKTGERLAHYLAEEFLRDVARSVALAEAAQAPGSSIGIRKVRQGGRLRDEPLAVHRQSVKRSAYLEGSLAKLRSLERVVGLKPSKVSKRRSK